MTAGSQNAPNVVSIRIAANFTIEPMEESLAHWLTELGIRADIGFAPYNQVFQQLLEGGVLRANHGGVNLIGLDLDAWLAAGPAALQETIENLMAAMRSAASQGSGGALLLFPPSDTQSGERLAALAAARESLIAGCRSTAGWSAIDLAAAPQLYSIAEVRDSFTHRLGDIPFTEAMYAAAATVAARWIRATCTKARKVIVLDCDNTIWGGICGEGAVEVSPPYRRLQEFMLRQQENGVLLALASKNNEADVMAVLESDACVLRPEHFTAWRINWQPKSQNLAELADELGLALNSFIFLDDSSYECLEVRNQCPAVLTIQLPADPETIPQFLDHLWAFDRPPATDEDRNRAAMYQAERQRAELGRRAMTQEEFLESLRLEIQIAPAVQSDFARAAQLTQRTTQFNLTGILHTEQSLTSLLAQERHECWTVRVRDTFGDYGLVGVVLFELLPEALRMESFLLSCRALGRSVEDRMVEHLRLRATERGLERIVIPVVPTARNRPALEFLNRLCGVPVDSREPFECVLSTAGDSSEWRPAATAATETTASTAPTAPALLSRRDEETLVRIAGQLRTAAAVIAAARSTRRPRPATNPSITPRSPIEASIAGIWSECLGVEPVGVRDSFPELGGTSLLATRILAHLRTEFGVELSLTEFFEHPTVEALSALVSAAAVPAT